MSDRIIIGDSELAVFSELSTPISAPVARINEIASSIRWRHTGTSFVLEQWVQRFSPSGGIWIEVPCVIPEQGKDK